MNPAAEDPESLPPAIVSRLRRLDRSQPIVDPRTDRAVLEAARRHFATRPVSSRARRRRWAMPFAAAAAVLLVAVLVRPFGPYAPPARDDVDGSGRVDILDVLALARMRAAGDTAGVTEARIEELAYRIVAIDPQRGSP